MYMRLSCAVFAFARRFVVAMPAPRLIAAISWCIKGPVMPKYSRTVLAVALLFGGIALGPACADAPAG